MIERVPDLLVNTMLSTQSTTGTTAPFWTLLSPLLQMNTDGSTKRNRALHSHIVCHVQSMITPTGSIGKAPDKTLRTLPVELQNQ